MPLDVDIKDWKTKLRPSEKNLLTQIFRFFTQADIEVNDCYMQHYGRIFKPTEVKMMLAAFSNMETVHIAAYSHLLDTIGMPETEYAAFLKYEQTKAKHDYLQTFDTSTDMNVAATLAAFGAFTEGLQLFASFAMLMNFQRFGKMKGMGQIVAWSVRDETLHCNSIVRLFHEFVREKGLCTTTLGDTISVICQTVVMLEDQFIDLAFEMGDVEGLTAQDVKNYVRYIANRRMRQLGYTAPYMVERNPLPWMDEVLNGIEHTNFFENRATEYSKAATQGSWDDAYDAA